MSGDDAAAAPIDGRVEWRARSGGISSPSSAPLGCRRDALMLSGGRFALCTRKVLGGNRFFVVFAGRDRSASGNAYSQSHYLEHKSCSHLTWRRTLVGFEMARDRFDEIVSRKDPCEKFRDVGTDRASVINDLCQRGRRRRQRGGGVRCCGTSTGSETQAGKARRSQGAGESRKKGWLSGWCSIS